jgi:hypothetical protein
VESPTSDATAPTFPAKPQVNWRIEYLDTTGFMNTVGAIS